MTRLAIIFPFLCKGHCMQLLHTIFFTVTIMQQHSQLSLLIELSQANCTLNKISTSCVVYNKFGGTNLFNSFFFFFLTIVVEKVDATYCCSNHNWPPHRFVKICISLHYYVLNSLENEWRIFQSTSIGLALLLRQNLDIVKWYTLDSPIKCNHVVVLVD